MSLAPMALFVYNRPWHTRQTVGALKGNSLSKESDLFIFSDAPKNRDVKDDVEEVRKYIKGIDGFKSVTIILREGHFGLARSIITGVTETVDRYGKIIVMEDDLVSSAFFLKFMNEALEFYQHEEKVIGIQGYIYPIKNINNETFFIKGADCLGWATWKKAWDLFEPDGQKLLDELKERHLTRKFDINGAYPYTRMLENQIKGKLESWAILWYASAFLNDRLSLYPKESLVRHIGNDGSGTNFGKLDILDCKTANSPIIIDGIPIVEDVDILREIERYFRRIRPLFSRRIITKIPNLLQKK